MASLITHRPGRKNPILVPGVHRFGRSKMYHKKGLFIKRFISNPKKLASNKPIYVEKPIGGASNGGTRKVQLKKSKSYHPTAISKSGKPKRTNRQNTTSKLRASLKPGTVVILLAGRHAGKRVVFLKRLQSGLLLVTGPFKINGVPLRRIHQQYVIATSTRLDLSTVTVPQNLDDSYFRRDKKAVWKERKAQEGDIFAPSKSSYELSDGRKLSQAEVDKQILTVIKANEEKKLLFKYLASPFSLKSTQYPHEMKF